MGLQFAALLLASYLGFARTYGAETQTSFSQLFEGWDDRWRSLTSRFLPAKSPQEQQQEQEQLSKSSPPNDVLHLQQSLDDDVLRVPCGYIIADVIHQEQSQSLDNAVVKPLRTYVDPFESVSTISKSVVLRDPSLKKIYEEMGASKVIPKGSLYLRMGSLDATLPSPELVVTDDDSEQDHMQLGRNFLRRAHGRIDLDEMELYVTIGDKTNVIIPFIQPRRAMPPVAPGEGEL